MLSARLLKAKPKVSQLKQIEKIVEGKLNKFLAENCLLEQAYVKNPDQTIQEVLTEKISKMGENMVDKRFARFQVGTSFHASV